MRPRSSRWLAWIVPIGVEAGALLRSILLAWLISPTELGRAMLLGLVLRLVEMLSDFGVERLLVQAPDGDGERLQAQLQGALILRGVVVAGLIAALAPAFHAIYPDGPEVQTYLVLALIPLLRGGVHLDARRAERHFFYGRMAMVELGATGAMLIALPVAAAIIGASYTVLLAAMLVQALVHVTLSHLVATRRYAVRFDLTGLRRIWIFGAPLVVNAGLMFLTLQADRLIVASVWSWQDLAIYGIAAQLAWLPAQIYGRAATSLLLPKFRMASREGRVASCFRSAMRLSLGLALLFAVSFVALAGPAIGAVYGVDLRPDAMLILAFGAAAALRILRTPISVLAVAEGRTGDTARANLWRAGALAPALALAWIGTGLPAFAAMAAVGELAAALAGWRLYRNARGSGYQTPDGKVLA